MLATVPWCLFHVSKLAFLSKSLIVVRTVCNAYSRVPVDSVVRLYMMWSNVIAPFLFVPFCSFSGLAVAAFVLISCSLSFPRFVPVLNVCQQLSQSCDRFLTNTDTVGLWDSCNGFRGPFDVRASCSSSRCRVSVHKVGFRVSVRFASNNVPAVIVLAENVV